MNVVLCEKCRKPMKPDSKDVCKITIQVREGDNLVPHTFDTCIGCAGELINSLSQLGDEMFPEYQKELSKRSKDTDSSSDEGKLSKMDKIKLLLEQGKSNKEIADTVGCAVAYVSVVKSKLVKSEEQKKVASVSNEPVIEKAEAETVIKPVTSKVTVGTTSGEGSTHKKIDIPKVRALLRAGWSIEKIARTEFHCSIAELKDALDAASN